MQFLIQKFRNKVDTLLEESKTQLVHDFPNVIFSFYRPEGSFTTCLSALIKDAPHELPDLVEFEIIIDKSSSGEFQIYIHIIWSDCGIGYMEARFSDDPVLVNEETLRKVYAGIPKLLLQFKTAIQRGKPHDWDERTRA